MIRLSRSLAAWKTPEFRDVLKQEIECLDARDLPLQQGLASSSYVTDQPFQAIVITTDEDAKRIRAKAGIFYTGVIAGCNCSDDPSPVDAINEYCVVRFDIDRLTADTTVTLLDE